MTFEFRTVPSSGLPERVYWQFKKNASSSARVKSQHTNPERLLQPLISPHSNDLLNPAAVFTGVTFKYPIF